jgi:uncharacterized protein (DUF1800 family)
MPENTKPSSKESAVADQPSRASVDNDFLQPNRDPSVDKYAPHALSLIATALLAACGGGGSSSTGGGGGGDFPSAPGFNNSPQAKTDEEAARFLQQSQFASTPTDIAAVRSTSFAGFLQQQFAKPMNSGWDWLESRNYGATATLDKYVYSTSIADFMIWGQLMSAPDAMRKRVALALSEFFVVSLNSMEIDWRGYTITAYWDLLNQHAFGNYRDLLEAITLNPGMGYFLNTRGNKRANNSGRLPDENYAREVMQLFTIGLYKLNLDGSVELDSSGKKLESYDSDDVSQLARVFTGYDYDASLHPYDTANGIPFPGQSYKVWPREYARRPMTLKTSDHSPEAINFLNASIPAGTPGATALTAALNALFNHPNVGPFFGRQMIQRLVTSNPSPAYVARVASAFNNNGAGVRGDMKAVWTAILLDDEARGTTGLTDTKFGKLREPMLRLVNWARTFGAVSAAGSWKIFDLSDASNSLGQSPLHAPSVFNFFRPGYVPPGTDLARDGITVPEFQIVNETTVGGYINFMDDKIRNGFRINNPSSSSPDYVANTDAYDIVADYTTLLALINNTANTDAEALRVAQSFVVRLNLLLCAGQLSAGSITTITNALRDGMRQRSITSASNDSTRRDLVAAAILLVMASPDYLIQK